MVKNRVKTGYIHYESKKDFESIAYWVSFTLMENISIMQSHIVDNDWYDRLKEEGFFTGAYLREGSEILRIGPAFLPRFDTNSRIFIDEEQLIHFVHIDSGAQKFSEFILSPLSIEPILSNLRCQPEWIALYDSEEDSYSTVLCREDSSVEHSVLRALSEGTPMNSSLFGSIHFMKQLDLQNPNFYLIAKFPFRPGYKFYVLIGLIVILLITILLLYSHIIYILSKINILSNLLSHGSNETPASNVVSEIDDALTRFTRPTAGDAPLDKTVTPSQIPVEREIDDNLESDGIRIKKT